MNKLKQIKKELTFTMPLEGYIDEEKLFPLLGIENVKDREDNPIIFELNGVRYVEEDEDELIDEEKLREKLEMEAERTFPEEDSITIDDLIHLNNCKATLIAKIIDNIRVFNYKTYTDTIKQRLSKIEGVNFLKEYDMCVEFVLDKIEYRYDIRNKIMYKLENGFLGTEIKVE